MSERAFLIFLLFYSEFSCPGRVGTEFGTKIFCSLSQPTHPVLARNNSGKWFFNFLNFFAIFSGIFLLRSRMNANRDENFFHSFSASLNPFWIEITPELTFLIFLLFFLEFSSSGWVGTEFGSNFFFFHFLGLSHPVWAENNAGKRFF